MVKKILALILTVVLLGSFMVVPASAEETLDSYKFFSVDYRTQIEKDLIGKLAPVFPAVPTLPKGADSPTEYVKNMVLVEDADLGKSVAHFDGTYSIGFEIDQSKLLKDFTVEVYFKLGAEQKDSPWSQICGNVWMSGHPTSDKYGHGFSLNTGKMQLAPQDGPFPGEGDIPAQVGIIGTAKKNMLIWSTGIGGMGFINNTFAGTNKATMEAEYEKWQHVVYTYDDAGHEVLYWNGVEIINRDSFFALNGEIDMSQNLSNDMSKLFRIGGYNWANNWDMKDMKCAYVNLYEIAATTDEVAALYANKDVVSEIPDDIDSTPIPVATPDPNAATPAPSADTGSGTTPAPTKAPTQNNTQTFDLGLVSLAAVALSSVVVTKKKRK